MTIRANALARVNHRRIKTAADGSLKEVVTPCPELKAKAFTSHVFAALLLDFASASRAMLGNQSNAALNAAIRRFLMARKTRAPDQIYLVTLTLGQREFIGTYNISNEKIRVRFDERWSKYKPLSDGDDPFNIARGILYEMVQSRA